MTKAVLSNRIYINIDNKLSDVLSLSLTYKIPPKLKGTFPEIIKNYRRISNTVASIPSGRMDLIPDNFTIIDERVCPEVVFPKFKYALRASQQEIYDQADSSCIINALPSWGKTFMGIALATKFKTKTLVVTHTTFLRNQWEEEVEKTLGISPAVIGEGKFNIDSPIVVSNIQTLIKYVDKIKDTFGLVIVDEAHHTPASTFAKIVDQLKAKYKIGLTGTLVRKDGKHIIFQDFFGQVIFKPEKENSMTPSVLIVDLPISFPPGKFWANRVTELETHNAQYQSIIASLATRAAAAGHKVLVLGSRTEFLRKTAALTTVPSVVITGEIKNEARQELLDRIRDNTASILYGTASLFSEGISLNDLSCIILATNINNEGLLTQIIGRIIRVKEGKCTPLIIDIHLLGSTVKNQAKARMSLYLKEGYKIQYLKN